MATTAASMTGIPTTHPEKATGMPQTPSVGTVPEVVPDNLLKVADRALYNSTQFNRQMVLVDPAQSTLTDNTPWAAYVNAAPVHTLVYLNPLEIVVSPWWNLSEPYLDSIIDVPEASPDRAGLIGFKNAFYPGLTQDNAEAAIQGGSPALATTTI